MDRKLDLVAIIKANPGSPQVVDGRESKLASDNQLLRQALKALMDLDCPLTGNPSHDTLVEHWTYEKSQGRGEADDRLFALDVLAKTAGAEQ